MRAAPFLACSLLLAACADAPRPVDAPPRAQGGMPAGHPPTAMPADHPPIGGDMDGHGVRGETVPGACFGGTAVLAGELADATEGFLYANARRRGGGPTYMSLRVPVSAAQLDAQGRRAWHFHLAQDTDMMGGAVPVGVELELEVRFDRDGFVDTRDDIVSNSVPAEPGQDDLVIVLGG